MVLYSSEFNLMVYMALLLTELHYGTRADLFTNADVDMVDETLQN